MSPMKFLQNRGVSIVFNQRDPRTTVEWYHFAHQYLPNSTDKPDPAPRRVVRDELTPEHAWTERYDSEDQNGHYQHGSKMYQQRLWYLSILTFYSPYLPLFAVGASSDVTANAVNSLIPAPMPAKTMPPMKTFIVWNSERQQADRAS